MTTADGVFKADLHVHTRYSRDSWIPALKLGAVAKSKGLSAVAITDHNTADGWLGAAEGCRAAGMPLIFGEEVLVKPDGKRAAGEIIGLFMNEFVDGKGKSAGDVMDALHAQGALAVFPHPFDPVRKIFAEDELHELAVKADAVEVFNAKARLGWPNKKAAEFAEEFNLACTGGSDAHVSWEVGDAYTVADCGDIEGLHVAIKKRKTRAEGHTSNPLGVLFPKLAVLRAKLFGV